MSDALRSGILPEMWPPLCRELESRRKEEGFYSSVFDVYQAQNNTLVHKEVLRFLFWYKHLYMDYHLYQVKWAGRGMLPYRQSSVSFHKILGLQQTASNTRSSRYTYTQTKQTVPYGLDSITSNIPLTTEAPSLLLVIGFSALLAILDVTLASYLNTS